MGYTDEQKAEMKSERARTERLLSAAISRLSSPKSWIPVKTIAEIICEGLDEEEAASLIKAIREIKEL